MYGSIFSLTLEFENVINLVLLCLSNLDYMTILLCSQKQSPSKCYSGRFSTITFSWTLFFFYSDQDKFNGTYCRKCIYLDTLNSKLYINLNFRTV